MRHVKSVLALILTLLFISQAAVMVAAAAEIQHPRLVVYGQVTKPVYPGRSIFEYKDDQGLSSTLPFERQDENISISFANIKFSKNFENNSVSLGTEVESSAAETSLTSDVLVENDLEYVYLKVTNTSALSPSTSYSENIGLTISDEPAVTNDYYIFVTAKVKTPNTLDAWHLELRFKFKDVGATNREIRIAICGEGSGETIGTYSSTAVIYTVYGKDNVWFTVQYKIQDLFDAAGVTWSLSKLTGVVYKVWFKTGETVESSVMVEAFVRHFFLSPSKIYIDDPAYTDGLVVNGTSGQFTPQAGDIIQVYGANATKIVGVTIPWQVEVTPEIDKDPDNLRMQYTWEFTMPKSPSSVGDTLTFSNTNMTLYGYKDGDAWDKLYLNGVDKLSSIASLKVPSDTDYWTYALATSLSEGNMYQAIARIQYTADEYDSLTTAPLFFENPVAWIIYKFWSLVIAVAAFLGLSATWAVKQRRKAQIPKVK